MRICDRQVEDVLDQVRSRFNADLPHFSDCISEAFSEVDAVFWREQYLSFYWKCVTSVPGYIQNVVLANATAESDGSAGLYELWRRINGLKEVETAVRDHYLDEARHSRLFVHLVNLSFPSLLQINELERLKSNLFDATRVLENKHSDEASIEYVLDNLIQMNIGEIRTRAHMYMIGPVLTAFAPKMNKEHVDGILTGLVYDEVTHIGYTAKLMDEWCRDGHKKLVRRLYKRRLRDFNQFTVDQTRKSIELYGNGEFPEIFEI